MTVRTPRSRAIMVGPVTATVNGVRWLAFPPHSTKASAIKSARVKDKAMPPGIRVIAVTKLTIPKNGKSWVVLLRNA